MSSCNFVYVHPTSDFYCVTNLTISINIVFYLQVLKDAKFSL